MANKTTQEKMVNVATYLNSLDKIEPNNKEIWSNFLHVWDNTTWHDIFTIMLELTNDNPKLLKQYQIDQLMKARTAFISSSSKSNHIMDLKDNKKYAWSVLMLIKETFNTMHEKPQATIKSSGAVTMRSAKKDYTELGHEHIAWHEEREQLPFKIVEHYDDRTVTTIYHIRGDE